MRASLHIIPPKDLWLLLSSLGLHHSIPVTRQHMSAAKKQEQSFHEVPRLRFAPALLGQGSGTGHTTRAPLVGFKQETNCTSIQLFVIANLDKTSLLWTIKYIKHKLKVCQRYYNLPLAATAALHLLLGWVRVGCMKEEGGVTRV